MIQRLLVCSLGICLLAIPPASAAADGVPQLDPTFQNNGTTYDFTMPGSSRSMDPVLTGGAFTWRGTLLLQQDQGVSDFNADMTVDTNGDGSPDRDFSCTGRVGNGRFGMRCNDSDGLENVRLNLSGRAVVLDSGRLSLRKASGSGFTETYTFIFSFNAVQQ
jgi:hypothetical protein